MDDGSTDGTSQWAQALQDPRIHYHHLPHSGVSHARNQGIQRAQGEWIAFLDSDDLWLPQKLEKQIQTKCMVVHTEEIWMRNGQRVNPKKKHQKRGGRLFIHCIPLCCISPSSVLIHKEVFHKVGLFKEHYPVCEDYDLWLRITALYHVDFIEEPLVIKHGGHSDQLSRKFHSMDYWRVLSLKEHLRSPLLNWNERKALVTTLLKKCDILLKGYIKHQNMQNYDEIFRIQNEAKAFLKNLE